MLKLVKYACYNLNNCSFIAFDFINENGDLSPVAVDYTPPLTAAKFNAAVAEAMGTSPAPVATTPAPVAEAKPAASRKKKEPEAVAAQVTEAAVAASIPAPAAAPASTVTLTVDQDSPYFDKCKSWYRTAMALCDKNYTTNKPAMSFFTKLRATLIGQVISKNGVDVCADFLSMVTLAYKNWVAEQDSDL